jgi:hypothetical protein
MSLCWGGISLSTYCKPNATFMQPFVFIQIGDILKPQIYLSCVFIAVMSICIVIFLLRPLPLRDFSQEDCVWWLEWDISIHRSYLEKPDDLHNGTYASHQKWIDDFTQIVSRIKKEPSKLTKAECIQLLRLAQSTHAGNDHTDYATVNWHARWFEAYGRIVQFMEDKR